MTSTPAEAVDRPDEHAGDRSAVPGSVLAGLVLLSRPRQWIKNLLVFVAPASAGVLFHRSAFWHTLAAFGIFCIAASGTYYLNDALDAASDREHPSKRFRPVAAGIVPSPWPSRSGSCSSRPRSASGSWWRGGTSPWSWPSTAWSTWPTRSGSERALLDLAAVSAGFVLRAVAGVATGIVLSNWFLIVARSACSS